MINYLSNFDAGANARWRSSFSPDSANVNAEFGDGAVKRIAVNPDLARSLNLVSAGFSQNRNNEMLLEFVNRFGIEDSPVIHA
jgi:hypothetical protein